MRHVVAIGAAAAFVLVGCATTAAPSSAPPRPSIEATPSAGAPQAVAQAAAPSSPTPSSRAPSAAGRLAIVGGALSPGRYTTTAFEPPLTFTLGPGWNALFPDDPDEMALEFGADGGFFMTRVANVVDPTTRASIPVTDDLIGWLAAHPALDPISVPSATSVAGRAARSLEARAVAAADVFVYPTGNMRFDDGWTLRYRVVPLEGPDLTIVVFGTSDAAFTRMAALAEPVVASLAIGADK
jgi:hypothetical protein